MTEKNRCERIKVVSCHAGVMALEIWKVRRAKHYYEQALAHVPDDPEILYGLADTLASEAEQI
jgi:Tfp pilus assembly protein PilF